MKRVFIFVGLGVFLIFLGQYVYNNLPPLNFTGVQEIINTNKIKPGDWEGLNTQIIGLIKKGQILQYLSPNAYLEAAIILAAIFCFFIAFHLSIDKIFFKNFYENASIFNALRRGLILCVALFIILYLKLYGIDLVFILVVPILSLFIEIFYSAYVARHINKKVVEIKEFHKTFTEELNSSKNLTNTYK